MNIREDRPSHDSVAWLPVKLIAADGDTWNGKVEVKAHKQTVLKLAYSGKPATAAPASGKFIGKMMNLTSACLARGQNTFKFVAMKDGNAVYETTLTAGKVAPNVELEAGTYSVRVFRRDTFVRAVELQVTKDGWNFSYGVCAP